MVKSEANKGLLRHFFSASVLIMRQGLHVSENQSFGNIIHESDICWVIEAPVHVTLSPDFESRKKLSCRV